MTVLSGLKTTIKTIDVRSLSMIKEYYSSITEKTLNEALLLAKEFIQI